MNAHGQWLIIMVSRINGTNPNVCPRKAWECLLITYHSCFSISNEHSHSLETSIPGRCPLLPLGNQHKALKKLWSHHRHPCDCKLHWKSEEHLHNSWCLMCHLLKKKQKKKEKNQKKPFLSLEIINIYKHRMFYIQRIGKEGWKKHGEDNFTSHHLQNTAIILPVEMWLSHCIK